MWADCANQAPGLAKVDWAFTFAAAAYDLVRLPKLIEVRHEPERAGLRPRLRRALADHRDGRVDEIDLLGLHASRSAAKTAVNRYSSPSKSISMRATARATRRLRRVLLGGFDDGNPASGRGWAALGTAGRLLGHIFIHKGDGHSMVFVLAVTPPDSGKMMHSAKRSSTISNPGRFVRNACGSSNISPLTALLPDHGSAGSLTRAVGSNTSTSNAQPSCRMISRASKSSRLGLGSKITA